MSNFGLSIPAIRGMQGGRVFYVTNLPNAFLANMLSKAQPAVESSQRALDPKHAAAIADYIKENQKEYVMGALTYAMDRDGRFISLDSDSSDGFSIGKLQVPLDAVFNSLDGQHRREAIISTAAEYPGINQDSTAVLIYVEPDLIAKKQMFSDMNSTPKKVSNSLNVAFNNRDPFARVAKEIVRKHELLIGKVEEQAPRVKPESDMFFSLSSIQDTMKKLFVGSAGRVKDLASFDDKKIAERGTDFFNILRKARSEYGAAAKSHEDLVRLRTETILFSSTTLRAVAGAVYKAAQYYEVSDLKSIESKLVQKLSVIDFTVHSPLFIESGFIAEGSSTPSARNQEVISATNAIYEQLKDGTGKESDAESRKNRRIIK